MICPSGVWVQAILLYGVFVYFIYIGMLRVLICEVCCISHWGLVLFMELVFGYCWLLFSRSVTREGGSVTAVVSQSRWE